MPLSSALVELCGVEKKLDVLIRPGDSAKTQKARAGHCMKPMSALRNSSGLSNFPLLHAYAKNVRTDRADVESWT